MCNVLDVGGVDERGIHDDAIELPQLAIALQKIAVVDATGFIDDAGQTMVDFYRCEVFTALRRRLGDYPPRSAQKQQGRKNNHNGVSGNLLDELVDNNRPTNKDRRARNSSWPGALCSTKGRIHLRRLVFSPAAFSLQSDGGPYIRPRDDKRVFYEQVAGVKDTEG